MRSTLMNASLGSDTVPIWRMRFLPSFCFSSSFFFARDIAAVAFGKHVLAYRADGFPRDDLAADGRLHGNFKLLARDDFAELLRNGAALCIGAVAVNDRTQRVAHIPVEQEVQLDKVALFIAFQFIIERGVSPAAALELIEKIIDDLVERQHIVDAHAVFFHIVHVHKHARDVPGRSP